MLRALLEKDDTFDVSVLQLVATDVGCRGDGLHILWLDQHSLALHMLLCRVEPDSIHSALCQLPLYIPPNVPSLVMLCVAGAKGLHVCIYRLWLPMGQRFRDLAHPISKGIAQANISMDQAPMGGPSSSPRREGASPPSTRGGGLVYGRMRDGSGPTGLGNGSPIGGLGLK